MSKLDKEGTTIMRYLLYQLIPIAIIWAGIAFFYDELYDSGRIIFYVVTSWLLLLIVLIIKEFFQGFDKSEEDETKEK